MCERVFGVEEFLGGGCLRWIGGSGYRILMQNFREKGMPGVGRGVFRGVVRVSGDDEVVHHQVEVPDDQGKLEPDGQEKSQQRPHCSAEGFREVALVGDQFGDEGSEDGEDENGQKARKQEGERGEGPHGGYDKPDGSSADAFLGAAEYLHAPERKDEIQQLHHYGRCGNPDHGLPRKRIVRDEVEDQHGDPPDGRTGQHGDERSQQPHDEHGDDDDDPKDFHL